MESLFCVLIIINRIIKSGPPIKLREKILNFIVKWGENCKFCSALAQFRRKTSCISWRQNSIPQVFAAKGGYWRYHDVKTMAKWHKGIGVMWSVFDRTLNMHIYTIHQKGHLTIKSVISPIVVFPFAFDFAFKMHIKEKSFNKLSKLYVGISASVLLWFKEGGVRDFEEDYNG